MPEMLVWLCKGTGPVFAQEARGLHWVGVEGGYYFQGHLGHANSTLLPLLYTNFLLRAAEKCR